MGSRRKRENLNSKEKSGEKDAGDNDRERKQAL
jgi:hypothetical protein